jgi:hypothetical protein
MNTEKTHGAVEREDVPKKQSGNMRKEASAVSAGSADDVTL